MIAAPLLNGCIIAFAKIRVNESFSSYGAASFAAHAFSRTGSRPLASLEPWHSPNRHASMPARLIARTNCGNPLRDLQRAQHAGGRCMPVACVQRRIDQAGRRDLALCAESTKRQRDPQKQHRVRTWRACYLTESSVDFSRARMVLASFLVGCSPSIMAPTAAAISPLYQKLRSFLAISFW